MSNGTQALEIGVLLHTASLTGDGVARPDLTPLWDQARLVEKLGFASVWVGDSARTETAWPRADCISILTGLAMSTTSVRLGVVPLSVPLRNPVLLAHQLATVDVISNGRVIIGPAIGKGGPTGEQEFAACGVPMRERGARLTESLDLMRRLWTEEFVRFEGRFYSLLGETGIRPMPLQRPIPTLVCANGAEEGLRRAGRFGDGWFTTTRDIATFIDHRKRVDGHAKEAGRAGKASRTGLFATFHLDRDGGKARQDAERLLQEYFGDHHRSGANAGFFGSPQEVGEQLQAMVDNGLTEISARILSHDMEGQADLMLREMLPLITPRPLGYRAYANVPA